MAIAATIHIRECMDSPDNMLAPQIDAMKQLADALSDYNYSFMGDPERSRCELTTAWGAMNAAMAELLGWPIYEHPRFRTPVETTPDNSDLDDLDA